MRVMFICPNAIESDQRSMTAPSTAPRRHTRHSPGPAHLPVRDRPPAGRTPKVPADPPVEVLITR
jgi:hypothetical protein